MQMRIGIGLWCLQSTTTQPRSFVELYDELSKDAQLAERVGLDSIWLSEHHGFYDGYCPALLTAAGAALAATTVLHVGTSVLLLPLQDPRRVAAGAADLQQMSGGRLELGLGMGYREVEFAVKARDLIDRVKLMNAGLDHFCSAASPTRLANLPLWVGVTSPAAARRAGRRGLGLFISGAFSKPVVDELIDHHRRAWSEAGCPGDEPPPVALLRNLWLADTAAERRQVGDWVRSSYLVYAGLGWGADDTGVDFVSQIHDSMDEVEASALIGSADQVAHQLGDFDDVDLVVCRIGYDAPPRSAISEAIERIGTQLMPLIAGHDEHSS